MLKAGRATWSRDGEYGAHRSEAPRAARAASRSSRRSSACRAHGERRACSEGRWRRSSGPPCPHPSRARKRSPKRTSRWCESEAYGKLRLGAGVLLVAYGPPGSGKSTFTTRLLDAFTAPSSISPPKRALGRRCTLDSRDAGFVETTSPSLAAPPSTKSSTSSARGARPRSPWIRCKSPHTRPKN